MTNQFPTRVIQIVILLMLLVTPPVMAQDISGDWKLRSLVSDWTETIHITQRGQTINVEGSYWDGRGQFDGRQGRYQWQTHKGQNGHTDIYYSPSRGTLDFSSHTPSGIQKFLGTRIGR